MQYDLDEKVQALQNWQDNYRKLEEKLKKANEDKTLVARNATRQALQLVCYSQFHLTRGNTPG